MASPGRKKNEISITKYCKTKFLQHENFVISGARLFCKFWDMEHFHDTKVCTNVAHFAKKKNACENLMFYSIIKDKSFPDVYMFFLQDLNRV